MNKLFYLSLLIIFFITPKSYAENMCSSSLSSADSGTIYDSGGAGGNYLNSRDCGFAIQPSSSPTTLTLNFSQFTLEDGWDYLYIDDGTITTVGNSLGVFTGSSIPSTITSTTGSMYLRLVTDNTISDQGFTASWTSVTPEPELIASYNFDDDWVANNSLTDQTGSYNGSPGGSVSRVLSGAIYPKGDTCYAGSFAGGDIDITGLPVSTATGAKTSVNFWMNWDGTNSVMPMGWYQHDLWLADGYFGFNTFNNDLMGVSSSGLSSGWHHIVAVFTNGSVNNNKLYIDGVLQTLSSQRSNNAYLPNALVQSALRIGGTTYTTDYRFKGQLDNFKIYTGEISQAQVTADMNETNACPGPAIPILEYKFDACSLASTVEDTQGGYDGIATGTDSTDSTSVLGGRSLDLSATGSSDWVTIPTSAINGLNDFSFSVWIKTGISTEQQEIFQALGSSTDDDEFEIYIKESDEIKIKIKDEDKTLKANTTLTDNSWHHLVFTRQSDTICLYVDGSQTDCDNGAETGALSVNIANSVVIGQEQDSTRSSPSLNSGFNSAQSFKGYIDELKIYDSALSSTQIQTLYNDESSGDNTSTCSGGGGEEIADNFNCIEASATDANGAIKQIYTKLAGTPFNLDIVALKNNEVIKNTYNKTVTLEIIDQSSGNTVYSDENFEFAIADNARKQLTLQIDKAYSNLLCKVTYTTGSVTTFGTSDNFSVRPTGLTITSNLTNTSSSGIPKAKAGDSFTLTATAITTAPDGTKSTTLGYNGTPSINNSNIQAHADAIKPGSISGEFSAADSETGIATGNNAFSYSEVGLLQFTAHGIYDDSFTAVDQPDDCINDCTDDYCTDDFSNTPVSGKVGCKFGTTSTTTYFGRFTPDHLDVALNTPEFTSGCGTFTYIGQPVKYKYRPIATVTAKNASGITTQNYTGDFWKIDPAVGTGFIPLYSAASHNITTVDASKPAYLDSGNGSGTLTFADTSNNILAVTKSSITAPFDAEIALSFTLSDTDAIVVANVNGSTQVNPVSFGSASSGNGISFSNKSHRWGRVSLANAHGSELTALTIPVTTEYYDGTNFVKNTADNCTSFTLANDFSISDNRDYICGFSPPITPVTIGLGRVKSSMSNSLVNSGLTNLIISDNTNIANGPGTKNTGYVDITTDLTNLSWLNYDWDADGSHDNCPSARATFGIYKGNSKQIYFREIY